MTKRIWKAGAIEGVRPPTADELADLQKQLDAARVAHEALPEELWLKLDQILSWVTLQCTMSREEIRRARHIWVHLGIQRTGSLKGGYNYAVDKLKFSPAQAGDQMMRKDYETVQKRSLTPRRRQRKK